MYVLYIADVHYNITYWWKIIHIIPKKYTTLNTRLNAKHLWWALHKGNSIVPHISWISLLNVQKCWISETVSFPSESTCDFHQANILQGAFQIQQIWISRNDSTQISTNGCGLFIGNIQSHFWISIWFRGKFIEEKVFFYSILKSLWKSTAIILFHWICSFSYGCVRLSCKC